MTSLSGENRGEEGDGGGGLLDRVLRAERDAEARLAEARRACADRIEAARAHAQEVEQITDRRLERCRRIYGEQTETQVRAIAAAAEDAGQSASPRITRDRAGEAAMQVARRLVGLAE